MPDPGLTGQSIRWRYRYTYAPPKQEKQNNPDQKAGLLRKMQAPTVPHGLQEPRRAEKMLGMHADRCTKQADAHTHTHKHARLFIDRGGSVALILEAFAAGLGRVPHKVLSDGDAPLPYNVQLVIHKVSVVARAWHRDWRKDLL